MRWLAFLLLFLALAAPAAAVQPDEVLPDAALESRARKISAELRCLVCQNESIDDSSAPLARDLRLLVRDRLKAGDSDAEVTDFIVARYGEFVLLRPVFGAHTLLLWLGPVAIFLLGALVVLRSAGQGGRRQATALSAQEKAQLDAVLRQDDE
ncbi:cytochrome c-type biogenesis protein [Pseudochelatococcus sp. B33]